MEAFHKVSKRDLERTTLKDYIIRRFLAQDQSNPDPNQPQVDPNSLQHGQSVYDQQGEEYLVLQSDPTATEKIIMPKDQEGQPLPSGIEQVQDFDLTNNYSLQPTARKNSKKLPKSLLKKVFNAVQSWVNNSGYELLDTEVVSEGPSYSRSFGDLISSGGEFELETTENGIMVNGVVNFDGSSVDVYLTDLVGDVINEDSLRI